MWTWASGSYATAENSAIAASLVAQETRLALRALVDDTRARYAVRKWRQDRRRVPLAPGCLTTRVVAKATPTVRSKAISTHRTRTADHLAAIVTHRELRSGRLCV